MDNNEYNRTGRDAQRAEEMYMLLRLRYGPELHGRRLISHDKKAGTITKEEANLLRQYY